MSSSSARKPAPPEWANQNGDGSKPERGRSAKGLKPAPRPTRGTTAVTRLMVTTPSVASAYPSKNGTNMPPLVTGEAPARTVKPGPKKGAPLWVRRPSRPACTATE